jgi:hypothetical protein
MYVTSQPGRITAARTYNIPSKDELRIGGDGIECRVRIGGDGIILMAAGKEDIALGYEAENGETFDFSGEAVFYNNAANEIPISVITMDFM